MLEKLRVARFRFEMVALERATLPKFKGSTLRGGFGYTFKSIACQYQDAGQPCGSKCGRGNDCVYGYLFETQVPAGIGALQGQTEAPGPFVIEPPDDNRTTFWPGDCLHFDLLLYGRGVDYLPAFILTFSRLGQIGMGKDGGRFRLERVESLGLHNSADSRETIYFQGRIVAPFDVAESFQFSYPDVRSLTSRKLQDNFLDNAATARLPLPNLEVRFQTPLRQKYERDWLTEPRFEPLLKGIMRRAILLNTIHCGGDWEQEWEAVQPFLEMSQRVELLKNETTWVDWDRYSTRQQQKMNLGGLVGRAIYRFPDANSLAQLLPFLELARWLHVGKATVFGHGKFTPYLSLEACRLPTSNRLGLPFLAVAG